MKIHKNIYLKILRRLIFLLPAIALLEEACLVPTLIPDYQYARRVENQDPREALHLYLDLIDKYPSAPEIPEIRYQTACLYLALGERAHAESQLYLLRKSCSKLIWGIAAEIELTGLRSDLSPDEKIKQLSDMQTGIQSKLLSARVNYYLGECYFQKGDYNSALPFYRKALSLYRNSPFEFTYLLKIGICEMRTGNVSSACATLRRAESRNIAQDPGICFALADCARLNQNLQEALRELFKCVRPGIENKTESEISSFLDRYIDNATLEWATARFTNPEQQYLLRLETIRRFDDSRDAQQKAELINRLKSDYPEHISEIERIQSITGERVNVGEQLIGLLIPISGRLSKMGLSVYRGALLASEEYQAEHPDNSIIYKVYNTKGDVAETENGFRNLMAQGVKAIIGPLKSATTKSIATASEDYRIPVITPGCPDSTVCNLSNYLFRLYPSPYRETRILFDYIRKTMGVTRFAAVYPDLDYGRSAYQSLAEMVAGTSDSRIVFSVKYPKDITRMSGLLTHLKENDPEVVFIPDKAERAAQVAGQVRYQEVVDPIFIGTGAWENPAIVDIGGSHLEGSVFACEYPVLTGPRFYIKSRFKLKFGVVPDQFALRAFEAATLIFEAFENGYTRREDIRQYLCNPSGIHGIDGTAFFDQQGRYQPPVTIYTIENKKIKPSACWSNGDFQEISLDIIQ